MTATHVVTNLKGGWTVRRTGSDQVLRAFDTQAEAMDYARQVAQQEHGTLYLHRTDGTVRQKRSYAG